MPATPAQIAIAKKFEPVLLYHPGELYQPLDPKRWFETAALWKANAPFTNKEKWGFDSSPGTKFPRAPMIKAGGVALVPSETKPGQTDISSNPQFLSTHGTELELFLEVAGWDDSANVTLNSRNISSNLAAVRASTGQLDFNNFRHRYVVEIVEANALETLLQGLRADLDLGSLIRQQFRNPQLLLYHFFYPGHEEDLLGCEMAVSKIRDANFSGDWGCVAVLLDGSAPVWIGHSTHNAGPIEVAVKDLRVGMLVSPWRDVRAINDHPVIFVANGTHGNYLTPGDKNRPSFSPAGIDVSRLSCGAIEDAYNAFRDAVDTANNVTPIGETAKDALVAIAKVIAGAAIGGPFGALAGAFAAIGEALATNAPQVAVPPPLPIAEPLDQTPPHPNASTINVGLALRPKGLVLPVDIRAATVSDWNSSDIIANGNSYPFVTIRSEQPWWPPDTPTAKAGYEGRWGARVQQDPSDRRCGMQFPDFRKIFFRELFIELSKE
jgi:hypothetical protein